MNVTRIEPERLAIAPIERRAWLRYMGVGAPTKEVEELINACEREAGKCFDFRVCYRDFAIRIAKNEVDLGFARVKSTSLCQHLEGCDRILLLAATVGIGIDRLIAKYSRLSPARALCLQALGTERVESLCDAACVCLASEWETGGKRLTSRFSPGYGDLPLALQKDIFRVLDCPRQIGLSLNQSLLMTPTKSVTAIVGLRDVEKVEKETFVHECV